MALEQVLAARLPALLPRQRWFGGKSRHIASCHVDDVADLSDGIALAVVRVSYEDGDPDRYALLVMTAHEQTTDLPVIGSLDGSSRTLVEAASSPSAVRALLRGFDGGEAATRRGGSLRYADATVAASAAATDPGAAISPLGTEQSNTSLRVGKELVLKLFRRLDAGENPEVEVGRFLSARTSFRATPALAGSITYAPPAGEPSTIAVMQEWVANSGDGWSYTLAAIADSTQPGTELALAQSMARLGEVTAALHFALESDDSEPDFAPEQVTAGHVERWIADVLQLATRAFAAAERQSARWDERTRGLAQELLALRAAPPEVAARIRGAAASFKAIRIHGDYHLGQTLKTPDGFVIIDFEGEPARPLAERRRKHAALKDVAGMLRSLDYAVETTLTGEPHARTRGRLLAGMRQAFLDRYLETASSTRMTSIPAERSAIDRWLAFFELEKALYELLYEINHRPTWVHIPLRALLGALGGASSAPAASGR